MTRQRRTLLGDEALNQEINDIWEGINASIFEASKDIVLDHFVDTKTRLIACQTNSLNVILPPLSSVRRGHVILVKDESGSASSGTITIKRASSDLIEGSISTTITTDYGLVRLYAGKSQWQTF